MPQRSEQDKNRLKDEAKNLIRDSPRFDIDIEETTGDNDFKYKGYPDVVGVVVDLGSGRGFVQISGQEEHSSRRIPTGSKAGYQLEWLSAGQTCMLYGNPTVIYILATPAQSG